MVITENNWRVGMRVRRGPDWEWGNQDDKGDSGTIVRGDDDYSDEKWVWVKWDYQEKAKFQYRIGYAGFYDLVLDKHETFKEILKQVYGEEI